MLAKPCILYLFLNLFKYFWSAVAQWFKVSTSSWTRGHSLKLEKPRCRTTIPLQQFSQRIINDWNYLPEGAELAKDVNEFK